MLPTTVSELNYLFLWLKYGHSVVDLFIYNAVRGQFCVIGGVDDFLAKTEGLWCILGWNVDQSNAVVVLMFNFLLILLVINSCPSEGFRANTRLNSRYSFGTVLLLRASFIELSRIFLVILFRCASSLLDLHLHHYILIVLTSQVIASLIILFLILIVCLLICSYSRFRELFGNIWAILIVVLDSLLIIIILRWNRIIFIFFVIFLIPFPLVRHLSL